MERSLKALLVFSFMLFSVAADAKQTLPPNNITTLQGAVPLPRENPLAKAPAEQASNSVSAATANLQKRFTLEGFFEGETIGRGSIFSKLAGASRSFLTTTIGTWDGKVLTLVETYEYAATAAETRVWRFTKTGKGTYLAESEEILEKATVKIDGRVAKLKYKKNIQRPDKKKPTKVTFSESWTLKKNGVLESRTELKKVFRVGREAINFVRIENESLLKAP